MRTTIPFNEWLIEHEQLVAKYRRLVSEEEVSYRQMPIGHVVTQYVRLNNILLSELSDKQSAEKDALFNCIGATPTKRLHDLRDNLVVRYHKTDNPKDEIELQGIIWWLTRYISTGESRPIKSRNLPDIYKLGDKLYYLLKEYINIERSEIGLETLSPIEETELFRGIDYEHESLKREGFRGSELVEETVLNVLSNHHEDILEWAIQWDEFYNGFKQYASSLITKGEI